MGKEYKFLQTFDLDWRSSDVAIFGKKWIVSLKIGRKDILLDSLRYKEGTVYFREEEIKRRRLAYKQLFNLAEPLENWFIKYPQAKDEYDQFSKYLEKNQYPKLKSILVLPASN